MSDPHPARRHGVPPGGHPRRGGARRLRRGYAWAVTRLSVVVLAAWIAAAAAAMLWLPSLGAAATTDVTQLVPHDLPAYRAEVLSAGLFGSSFTAETEAVQRDPAGLSPRVQLRAVARALTLWLGPSGGSDGIRAALPVANTLGLLPGSRERSTTIVTYLFPDPGLSIQEQTAAAERFAHHQLGAPEDHLVGVTGPVPARVEQGRLIGRHLPWVEAATVLMVLAVVALSFRALGAPLAVLFTAGLAYVLVTRLVAWIGIRTGVTIPPDLEPVLVVLLLGVVTDYSIFFLTTMRDHLAAGRPRLDAASRTVAEVAPIIFAAGLIVAGGTAALLVARSQLIRAFGPMLAVTVLVSMLVSIGLIPALVAMFGRALFWPSRPRVAAEQRLGWRRARRGLARLRTSKPVALLLSLVAILALIVAGTELSRLRLGLPLVRALPASSEPARAEAAASQGFAPGILSPTTVVLQGSGIAYRSGPLADLEGEIRRQPDVAGVLGPAETLGSSLPGHVFLADGGGAARLAVIWDSDPLGGTAVQALRTLRARMPGLLERAGLSGTTVSYAGNTAIVTETIDATLGDLWRVGIATLVVDLLLLMVFLRAVVAPLYLMLTSVLALAASLGITVSFFQRVLGSDGITYFVPFVVAVLLVSLGADYNVFLVGRIWDEARRRPLREAVISATPLASRAINLAGLTLALSFAILALVPLDQFREAAFALTLGVLLDAFVVRPVLVPALTALFGRVSGWPGKVLQRGFELGRAA